MRQLSRASRASFSAAVLRCLRRIPFRARALRQLSRGVAEREQAEAADENRHDRPFELDARGEYCERTAMRTVCLLA
ncbi:hypothetical protein OKW49_008110 [Paraburkholderia youngii]|uniref:hypothetical protein n=1 Tax=Paraburkholderia youngii TaxID=2782701 RepID=UPI003D1A1EC3